MRAMSPLRSVLLLASLLAVQGAVLGQVLYKWVDKDGRTQYSDQPPKNFPGPVTRIEPDEKAPVAQAPPANVQGTVKAPKANDDVHALIEMAAKKRAARDVLEARVTAARANLEAAKSALENAVPGDDERQVIQQRMDQGVPLPGPSSSTTGGMFGMGAMSGTAPRSNCTVSKNAVGNNVITCPTAVPSEAYYDRMKQLQDAVTSAEEELASAETAYRRGVD